MKKSRIIKSRNELANILAKLEAGKTQAKVGDIRQAMKLMVELETAVILHGKYASPILMLRKEAKEKAAKIKLKNK